MDDLTAYHESGHAVLATLLGGVVNEVTIEPEDGDRYGNTEVAWPMASVDRKQHVLREIRTLMAGPIAEKVYAGDQNVLEFTAETSGDWLRVIELSNNLEPDPKKRSTLLAKAASDVQDLMADDGVWAAVSALADELEAHETLEGEAVKEVLGFWLSRRA